MVSTRVDSNQLLQVYQPENNAWTQAVTLVQLVGGFDVELIGAQGVALQQVAVEIQRLGDLLTELRKSTSYSSSIVTTSQQILDSLGGISNANLGAIAIHAAAINAHQSIIEQKLDSIANRSSNSATSATVSLVKFTSSDSEYSVNLPAGTKAIRFRSRKIASIYTDIRYSFAAGQVGSVTNGIYSTLAGGSEYSQSGLNLVASNLYFSATSTTAVVEVEIYS